MSTYHLPLHTKLASEYPQLEVKDPPPNTMLEVTFYGDLLDGMSNQATCRAYVEDDGTWHFNGVKDMTAEKVITWKLRDTKTIPIPSNRYYLLPGTTHQAAHPELEVKAPPTDTKLDVAYYSNPPEGPTGEILCIGYVWQDGAWAFSEDGMIKENVVRWRIRHVDASTEEEASIEDPNAIPLVEDFEYERRGVYIRIAVDPDELQLNDEEEAKLRGVLIALRLMDPLPPPPTYWVQCSQCGWGVRCCAAEIEVGDYAEGRACGHCGVGSTKITKED